MTESTIRERAKQVRSLEAQRLGLIEEIREAHKAGATIRQLQDWTGYSRRSIYYMLSEDKK